MSVEDKTICLYQIFRCPTSFVQENGPRNASFFDACCLELLGIFTKVETE
jgi:hypothetical protein